MSDEVKKMKETVLARVKPGQVISLYDGPLVAAEEGLLNIETGRIMHKEDIDIDDMRGWTVDINTYFQAKFEGDNEFNAMILTKFAEKVEAALVQDADESYEEFAQLPKLLRQAIEEFTR